MTKILNFIISMFHVKGLKRFSKMSGFIALMIFLLEINLLYLPIKPALTNHIDDMIDNNIYTAVFNNVIDTFNQGIDGIKESDYYIKEKDEYIQMFSKVDDEGIVKYQYEYEYLENNYKVWFVFDVNSVSDKEIENIYDKFLVKFPNEEENKATYISMLLYTEGIDNDDDLLTRMNYYNTLSIEDLEERLNALSYVDLYNIPKEENTYMMLFLKYSYLIEVPSSEEGVFQRASFNYNEVELHMSDVSSISDFSKPFVYRLALSLVDQQTVNYFGTCLLYVLLYPIIMAAILYVCLKNRGSLKTFKEFYSLISIFSILPAIIAFALTFVMGTGAAMIYAALLSLYTLIRTYKVIRIED